VAAAAARIQAMPGILAFVGADGAAFRDACHILRRRPFHEIRLAGEQGGPVQLACVSEHGGIASDAASGVVAVLDGEFHDGVVRAGDAAAAQLLALYLERGAELDPPDGWFNAVVWDPRRDALVLLTDLSGQKPLYVARSGARILVSGELKALLPAIPTRELDLTAWAQLLAYEFMLGDLSPLGGVRLVPAASTLELRLAGGERLHERWRFRLEPALDGDVRELTEEVGRLTAEAVAERLDDHTVLGVSGGLDSRTILATLVGGRSRPLVASYGVPRSEDLRLGAAIARAAGFPHVSLPLRPGYLLDGAEATVRLGEGSVRCLHSHHLVLSGLRTTHDVRSVMIGFAGDSVFRAFALRPAGSATELADNFHGMLAKSVDDALLEEMFTPSFAGALRGLAADSLRRRLAEEEGDDVSRVRQFVWNHGQRRKVSPGALLFADDLAPRDPLADRELIDFCRRMPERLRQDGVLQRAFLGGFPELAGFVSPKDGVAPGLRGRRRRLSIYVVKARRKSRARIDDTLGFRWISAQRGIGDYASDLRTASRPLLDVLLEPRTLERGQLRQEPVRRLIAELETGRRRNTRTLGMLLTLEMFQRQFVDGDSVVEATAERDG
jgi:asparagine synthase (glutamine-hydrolysing)